MSEPLESFSRILEGESRCDVPAASRRGVLKKAVMGAGVALGVALGAGAEKASAACCAACNNTTPYWQCMPYGGGLRERLVQAGCNEHFTPCDGMGGPCGLILYNQWRNWC